jgi:hypothetical protein
MLRRRYEPQIPSPTDTDVDRMHQWVEAVVLRAYGYAMSSR